MLYFLLHYCCIYSIDRDFNCTGSTCYEGKFHASYLLHEYSVQVPPPASPQPTLRAESDAEGDLAVASRQIRMQGFWLSF
jgi:hypothetical protein